jgi:hypothetical protein
VIDVKKTGERIGNSISIVPSKQIQWVKGMKGISRIKRILQKVFSRFPTLPKTETKSFVIAVGGIGEGYLAVLGIIGCSGFLR